MSKLFKTRRFLYLSLQLIIIPYILILLMPNANWGATSTFGYLFLLSICSVVIFVNLSILNYNAIRTNPALNNQKEWISIWLRLSVYSLLLMLLVSYGSEYFLEIFKYFPQVLRDTCNAKPGMLCDPVEPGMWYLGVLRMVFFLIFLVTTLVHIIELIIRRSKSHKEKERA